MHHPNGWLIAPADFVVARNTDIYLSQYKPNQTKEV